MDIAARLQTLAIPAPALRKGADIFVFGFSIPRELDLCHAFFFPRRRANEKMAEWRLGRQILYALR